MRGISEVPWHEGFLRKKQARSERSGKRGSGSRLGKVGPLMYISFLQNVELTKQQILDVFYHQLFELSKDHYLTLRLWELTKDICPNRLEGNHRMHPSMSDGFRCLDCGKFRHAK
jgi:hypothetical protein